MRSTRFLVLAVASVALVALVASGCSTDATPRTPSSSSSSGGAAPVGLTSHTITVDGVARHYLLYRPASLPAGPAHSS